MGGSSPHCYPLGVRGLVEYKSEGNPGICGVYSAQTRASRCIIAESNYESTNPPRNDNQRCSVQYPTANYYVGR